MIGFCGEAARGEDNNNLSQLDIGFRHFLRCLLMRAMSSDASGERRENEHVTRQQVWCVAPVKLETLPVEDVMALKVGQL